MQDRNLSAFEMDLLYEIGSFEAADETPHGLRLKGCLEDDYGKINNGRLYPALNSLEEIGLVDVEGLDGRTNGYSLTEAGRSWVEEDVRARQQVATRL